MLSSNNFFKISPESRLERTKTAIDVGGELFQALAVTVMDYLKKGDSFPEAAIEKIVGRFFSYFPDYKMNQAHTNAIEQMRLLQNNPRKTEIIHCLAYVLRQITVDEVLKNPLAYKRVFSHLDANQPQAYLRKAQMPLDLSAVSALANALNIRLILSCTESQKELRQRIIHTPMNSTPSLPSIELQVKNSQYCLPVIQKKNEEHFSSLGLRAIAPPQASTRFESGTLEKQLKLIDEDNHRLWKQFEAHKTVIEHLSLTKEELIDLYIKFLPKPEDLDAFKGLKRAFNKTSSMHEGSKDKKLEYPQEIVDGLACYLSTSQTPEAFYDAVDQYKISFEI